jgi:hypothetical protein
MGAAQGIHGLLALRLIVSMLISHASLYTPTYEELLSVSDCLSLCPPWGVRGTTH